VRKGFQSLMTQDRSAAYAWFEQALKLDPNNEGLKRLLELVDFTSKYQTRPMVVQTQPLQPGKQDWRNPVDDPGYFLSVVWRNPADNPAHFKDDTVAFLFKGEGVPMLYLYAESGTFRPPHGGTLYLPYGVFTVMAGGKLKPSTNEEDVEIWKEYFKGGPDSKFQPLGPVKKP